MNQENKRAAQKAHENVGRPPEDYDDEGRPAAARARDADAAETGAGEAESPGDEDHGAQTS